jgi:seryl-tRNA synthetase
MLDIKYLKDNIDLIKKKMSERGQQIDFDYFIQLDSTRRSILQEVENLRGERNRVSKEIGQKKARKEDAADLIAEMVKVSYRIKELV